jgi:hypothetical protein
LYCTQEQYSCLMNPPYVIQSMDPAKVSPEFRKPFIVVIATIPTCGILVWQLSTNAP